MIGNKSTIVSRVCDVLFLLFAFCYLFVMQQDVLALSQHVYSGGKTSYSPLWGTIILLFVAFLLQVVCRRFFKLKGRFYSFSWIPSVVFLLFVVNLYPAFTVSKGIMLGGILLVFCLLAYFFSRNRLLEKVEHRSMLTLFSWNVGTLLLVCGMLGGLGNTNDVLHYELKVQRLLMKGDTESALLIAKKSLNTSRTLSALRAFALQQGREMGESFFRYPQRSGAEGLLLPAEDSVCMLLSPVILTQHIDSVPLHKGEVVLSYLERSLENDTCGIDSLSVRDYWLTALLLEKQLDKFAEELPKYYVQEDTVDSLPKHYREALVLYKHTRLHPKWVYNDNVVNANYEDFAAMQKKYVDVVVRKNRLWKYYGDTYWWYYYYQGI